jgi:hypothetical protein
MASAPALYPTSHVTFGGPVSSLVETATFINSQWGNANIKYDPASSLYKRSVSASFQIDPMAHFHVAVIDTGVPLTTLTLILPFKKKLVNQSMLWFFYLGDNLPGQTLAFTAIDPLAAINNVPGPGATFNFVTDGTNQLFVVVSPGADADITNVFVIKAFGGSSPPAPIQFLFSEPVTLDVEVREAPVGTFTLFVGKKGVAIDNILINGVADDGTPTTQRVAIGQAAGQTIQGGACVAIGNQAGNQNQSSQAIAVGAFAGQNFQLFSAVAVGHSAGQTNQGANAIAMGVQAANSNQGTGATALGPVAGNINQGINATAVGINAASVSQGANAVAVGINAGQTSQGPSAVAIGNGAGNQSQGDNAVAIGVTAGETAQAIGATAVGADAGKLNQGLLTVAVGIAAGKSNQGVRSVAIGAEAANDTQGTDSVAVGWDAGITMQAAACVAIGAEAGAKHAGLGSVAIGRQAGSGVNPAMHLGIGSIAIGDQCADAASTPNFSVHFGAGCVPAAAAGRLAFGSSMEAVAAAAVAGGAVLPATPQGFIRIDWNGTGYKIPIYNP